MALLIKNAHRIFVEFDLRLKVIPSSNLRKKSIFTGLRVEIIFDLLPNSTNFASFMLFVCLSV